jgi:uncharacterized protein YdhG (YjbR/CyaY superfamily)
MTDAGVDAYLAKQPPEQRAVIERLREIVRAIAPDATEAISYGIIGLKLDGRVLVWLAGWKRHVSIYPLTTGFLAEHAAELERFTLKKGTLQLPLGTPIPDELIEALVRSRLEELRQPD